ncbi:MAG TPA: phosphatidate cytidylyltransferase [Actinomycetota bacterium]|nr:phosphatidate cytidylyltransferase [Actinomycetota bacterium]
MPRNPLAHPLFWPVAWRVALTLLAGLGGVVLAERKRLGQLGSSTLFLRVRTWAWIAPVFVLAVFTGGLVVFLLAAVIALQGVAEYARLIELERRYLALLAAWSIVGLLVAALARRYFLFLPLGFFLLTSLTPIVSGQTSGAHRQVSGAIFGYLYIGLPMAYLVFIKAAEQWGLQFLLVVGLAVALSDVCAFAVGSVLKGPKLAPAVSPGKTWAGAAGNLLGAALGVAILWVAVPAQWTAAGIAALIVAVAVGAVLGDLIESFVKRDFAVKDAGTILAGFGGVLDRVDSLLVALPLGYYALIVGDNLAGR